MTGLEFRQTIETLDDIVSDIQDQLQNSLTEAVPVGNIVAGLGVKEFDALGYKLAEVRDRIEEFIQFRARVREYAGEAAWADMQKHIAAKYSR
jgi:hypothetical protein